MNNKLPYNPLMEYKSPREDSKNKELFFEYYDRISKPKDTDILGNWQVWVYGSDREKYPPHCHIRLADGSSEFEVSLLDWNVINIKHSKLPNSWESVGRDIENAFFTWLDRPSTQEPSLTNKRYLYNFWDGANADNPLENWVSKKDNLDKDLLDYLNPKPSIDSGTLMAEIQKRLHPIYSGSNSDLKKKLHNLPPLQLVKELGLDFDISENNKKLINTIKTAEKMVYDWTL